METWTLKKDGYFFHCRYDIKKDWVYVSCSNLNPGSKDAEARASGPKLIASHLAAELIRDGKVN